MRKLNAKQKKFLDEYYSQNQMTWLTELAESKLSRMNLYESMPSDAERYLSDLHFKKMNERKGL